MPRLHPERPAIDSSDASARSREAVCRPITPRTSGPTEGTVMKSLSALVLASLAIPLVSSLAVAQEGTQDFDAKKLSSRTRADVRAEEERSRADEGSGYARGEGYGSFRPGEITSARTRAEVLAELEAARRARALDARNYSGVYGGFTQGEIRSSKTREEVLSELASARAAGVRLSQGERTGR